MACLRISRRAFGASTVSGELPLDLEALSEPVVAAGRDWLGLQGRTDAVELVATAAWVRGAGTDSTRVAVDLVDAAGARAWSGEIPPPEWARLATRAACALTAAGAWAPAPGASEIRYRLRLAATDPTPDAPRRLEPVTTDGDGGIDWDAPDAPDARDTVPWLDGAVLEAARCLRGAQAPDLAVVFAHRVWDAVVALVHEAHAAREERALVLFGERRRRHAEGGGGVIPVFVVERAVRPRLHSAAATGLVFEHSPLIDGGQGALALLHTHPSGCGLGASDHDRRDLEDLGPAAVSIIAGAQAARDRRMPRLAVHARLGARGGIVTRAATTIHVTQEIPRHAI